jgi:hypothetical protein
MDCVGIALLRTFGALCGCGLQPKASASGLSLGLFPADRWADIFSEFIWGKPSRGANGEVEQGLDYFQPSELPERISSGGVIFLCAGSAY